MKKLAITTPLIAASLLTFCSIDTSAESFQSEQNASFTFNPTMTVSISSDDISIGHLMPGSYADSDAVTITVSSNATSGYNLAATVGNNIYNYDSVKHTNGTNAFANLTSNKESLSAFSDNTWGYAYSNDSGSTWISGSTGSTSIGYNGLPLCTEETPATCNGVQIIDANINGSTTIDFKVGAKASTSQPAGDYSNVINFVGVSKPNPEPPTPSPAPGECTDTATCMQTTTSCDTTLTDARDGSTYTVATIYGKCWMTQNLRYLGDTGSAAGTMTIGNNNSNVSNKDITLYSLNSSNAGNFNAYSGHCDSTNGYNYACVYDSGSETTGVWYNYYAASGGTISGSNNSTAATNDICPSGWHLPSGPNTTSGTDYNKLVGNTKSGWQKPTAGLTAFGAVAGDFYHNGSLNATGHGYWWSATAVDATYRYGLGYDSSAGRFYGDVNGSRYRGYFVRCVRSS